MDFVHLKEFKIRRGEEKEKTTGSKKTQIRNSATPLSQKFFDLNNFSKCVMKKFLYFYRLLKKTLAHRFFLHRPKIESISEKIKQTFSNIKPILTTTIFKISHFPI